MKDNICFFGASTVQQKLGYTKYLSQKLNILNNSYGYGGNHINDAGICFIDKILKKNKYDYCFIDFFSTGYKKCNDLTIEYLDTIVYKFTKSNCKLIFLFLLRSDHIKRIQFYEFVKIYLNLRNLYYIDLNNFLEYSLEYVKDFVHTTDNGSRKYAEIIFSNFNKYKNNIKLPLDIIRTKYCDIQELNINKTFKNNIIIQGECTIIGFYLIVGPKSGLIQVDNIKYNIWDTYCHYDRPSFKLNNLKVSGKLELNVLQEAIDYSTCRRNIIEKDMIKELNIISIYYIGNELKIDNGF
jgi:hypothetical protein